MPHASQFLVLTFAGWLNRRQQDLIDYMREENHQGLDNRLVGGAPAPVNPVSEINRREPIGGLLNPCHRDAA